MLTVFWIECVTHARVHVLGCEIEVKLGQPTTTQHHQHEVTNYDTLYCRI